MASSVQYGWPASPVALDSKPKAQYSNVVLFIVAPPTNRNDKLKFSRSVYTLD
jgi:hypothetical protein